jgi:hypothetical protein
MMHPRGIEIRNEQYYNAALDRLEDVKGLKATGRGNSAGAAYLCGLSVECALRALIPVGREFYDRHNLLALAGAGALKLADERAYQELSLALNEMTILWQNTLRFYSEDRFSAFCRDKVQSTGLRPKRGTSPAKVLCGRLFDVSNLAFTGCARLWLK